MAYQAIPGPGSGSSSSSGFQYLNSPFGDTTYRKVLSEDLLGRLKANHAPLFEHLVTFREPEAAKRACADPTPIIDGRRANCNLASLGRPRPPMPYGRLRPAAPYTANVQTPRGTYIGYQQPLSYSYQQGMMYHPYGYAGYGPEYVYPQGVYNPYAAQQYLQIYGVPGTVNAAVYPYGQLGQTLPGGHGYTAVQGFAMPGHQIVQFSGPSVNAITTSPMPTIQAPYATGLAAPVPAQPQFIVPAPSQYMQGSGSDQTAGSYIVVLTRESQMSCVTPNGGEGTWKMPTCLPFTLVYQKPHILHGDQDELQDSNAFDGCWKWFPASVI
ncbi:RNA binding protein, putative [Ricinus communis]|uniref:RNA binding protein, putative n=1 Tax=Ricinus communis TaxID=3988 RepID=B9R8T5_RICCO|nr:RNA binding protein, putative [Ricinus communis]